jgi:hypothetical protein
MIDELRNLIPGFPGAKNRTRCFAHIINLVVKRILILFDNDSDDAVANTEKRLQEMNIDINFEDLDSSDNDSPISVSVGEELEEICDQDDFEAVREAILPVRAVIAKVSQ